CRPPWEARISTSHCDPAVPEFASPSLCSSLSIALLEDWSRAGDSAESRRISPESLRARDRSIEVEVKTMEAFLAGLLVFAVFFGPFIARLVFDRRLDRANIVAADVRAAVRHRLGGDSMVSVQVEPAGLWSRGRVLLVAPGRYQALIEK